ncbi:MAG: DUF4344 domain-containing metallopeptidase [Gammaproteobacteria bacterium]
MRRVLLATLLVVVTMTVHAEVTVSPYIIEVHKGQTTVPAGHLVTIPFITNAQPGDAFGVGLIINNAVYRDISAYVMDQTNLNLFEQGVQGNFSGVTKQLQRGNKPIVFIAKADAYGAYMLVLDNRYAHVIAKKVSWEIETKTRLPDNTVQSLKSILGRGYAALKKEFVFTDFNIHVQPCGIPNAFSSPDITICYELMDQLIEQHETDALSFVIFHEMGHSLMNVWGLPDYNNEDMADQFAAALLLRSKGGVESLDKAIEWFSSQNFLRQAQYMLAHGDPHSLSVQRVRNIQGYIANPSPMEKRWDHIFYPHMTITALRDVIAHPGKYDDVALAKQSLAILETDITPH